MSATVKNALLTLTAKKTLPIATVQNAPNKNALSMSTTQECPASGDCQNALPISTVRDADENALPIVTA